MPPQFNIDCSFIHSAANKERPKSILPLKSLAYFKEFLYSNVLSFLTHLSVYKKIPRTVRKQKTDSSKEGVRKSAYNSWMLDIYDYDLQFTALQRSKEISAS